MWLIQPHQVKSDDDLDLDHGQSSKTNAIYQLV
jgi:hypothetical protein